MEGPLVTKNLPNTRGSFEWHKPAKPKGNLGDEKSSKLKGGALITINPNQRGPLMTKNL